jgi:hypothetical protein
MMLTNVVPIAVSCAVVAWAVGLTGGGSGTEGRPAKQHGRIIALLVVLAAVFWSIYAEASGARLDYEAYTLQWQVVLDAGQSPWAEGTRNAYGPLYNLLAWVYQIDPFLPKALFVGLWICSSLYFAAVALRRPDGVKWAYGITAAMLAGPFFALLVAHYGYFDILPAVLCLVAVGLRLKGRDAWAGLAVAAAVLLKYYPLAVVPFLMLDGRRIRWRLGIWCVVAIAIGMAGSLLVWGESTLQPLTFATDRESKWLSVFRYLRGPYSPLALFTDEPSADFLMLPAMLVLGGGTWAWCWLKRVPTVPACIVGLAVALQVYKVGHVQFQMPLVLLLFLYAAMGGPDSPARRRQLIGAAAYVAWLSAFVVVYAILRRYSREVLLESIRDFTGLIGLAMTLWLVLPILTVRLWDEPGPTDPPNEP